MYYNMKKIRFCKYHGCGNDFIIIHDTERKNITDLNSFIKRICNRYLGVGADGFIVAKSNPLAMEFYNQDGSAGSMCGNGIRSLSAFFYDENIVSSNHFFIMTPAGEIEIEMVKTSPYRFKVTTSGFSFNSEDLEIDTSSKTFFNQMIDYNDLTFNVYAIFLGTKHLVIFVDNFDTINDSIGSYLSNYHLFKDRINVDFVKVIDKNTIQLKTYERGVGFTKACGTGACASLVVAHMLGLCESRASVIMELGSLEIEQVNDNVIMEGPAEKICEGYFIWEENDENR